MAVLRIARMGNPVLLKPSEPVADPTAPEIRRLAQDMQDTIEDIGASGIAAPQVFVPKRVVVYRMIASRIPPGSGLQPRPWTVMVKVIGTAGSTRYSYRDHVEIKAAQVHSQTYTAYQGSITSEVRHFLVDCLRHGTKPLSTLEDAVTAQRMIEAAEESIRTGKAVKM